MSLIHALSLVGFVALVFSWVMALLALRIARKEIALLGAEIARLRAAGVLLSETFPR